MDMTNLRSRYPILETGIFLNHAATAPVSYATILRMKELSDEMREPLGKHFYPWLGIMEETRRLLAELIHAHPSEIALTSNTSTSLSLIAGAIDWRAGDRILVPRDEFPSNRYVWQNLASQGVIIEFFDVDNARPLIEILKNLDLSNVRLISISMVSYLSGKRHDIATFGAFCRKHSILSCVDAIQAVGTIPVDVHAADIDFLAGGAQKWLLGPIGCGYLYIRKELLEHLKVPLIGWTSVQYPEDFDLMELDFAHEATRFEPGLPSIASIGGLNSSLKELGAIGWESIYNRLAELRRVLVQGLGSISQLRLMVPNLDAMGAIVSFELPKDINPKKLLPELAKYGVTVTSRGHYMRVSPHFYTNESELARFVEILGGTLALKSICFPEVHTKAPQIEKRILLLGAAGVLGREIALYFAEKGYQITAVDIDTKSLESLQSKIKERFSIETETVPLDLRDTVAIESFVSSESPRFHALVNCAMISEPELFSQITSERLEELFQVNVLAPAQFMRAFITRLHGPDAHGILNFLAASGRCGYPLLGANAGGHAALWTMTESLQRELCRENLQITNYIAPAMHSRMQKILGRVALRYFKMSGSFDYAHAEEVARDAVDSFLNGKDLVVSWKDRMQLVINCLWPRYIKRKIAKFWRTEELDQC